jgi:signal transduction histidine kinase
VVDNKIKFLRLAAASKNLTMVNNVPSYITVYADIDHIRFVVRNLLANAVKFSRSNGQIEIGATLKQGRVECFVKDSGIGIAETKLADVFEPFNRSTPGTASEVGNGIGLMLVKEFVMQNGGSIWVESKKEEGATFFFTLPKVSLTSA